MSAPRVIVTDAARGSAVSIIRSLGRRGAHVIAADADRVSPGFYSRHTADRLIYPQPDAYPGELVETLLHAARERDVDLIVPVTDDVIVPLAQARERFDGVCKLAIAPSDALDATRDKQQTLELARKLGIPAPRTALVETAAEARREAAKLGWPVVLKPQASRVYATADTLEALNVTYAGGFARLAERMARYEGLCPVLLQEYTTGEAFGVELLMDGGRPLATFQHRRLREVPVTGGASSYRESVPLDPQLLEFSVRMLEALEWTGLAMVEFKTGRGGPKLMEINGRVWGSLPLAIRSGVDFPAGLLDLYLGTGNGGRNGAGAESDYRLGVRMRHLEFEIVWIGSVLRGERRYPFLEVPPRRAALATAFDLVWGRAGFDMAERGDVKPALVDLLKIAEKLGRKLPVGR